MLSKTSGFRHSIVTYWEIVYNCKIIDRNDLNRQKYEHRHRWTEKTTDRQIYLSTNWKTQDKSWKANKIIISRFRAHKPACTSAPPCSTSFLKFVIPDVWQNGLFDTTLTGKKGRVRTNGELIHPKSGFEDFISIVLSKIIYELFQHFHLSWARSWISLVILKDKYTTQIPETAAKSLFWRRAAENQ